MFLKLNICKRNQTLQEKSFPKKYFTKCCFSKNILDNCIINSATTVFCPFKQLSLIGIKLKDWFLSVLPESQGLKIFKSAGEQSKQSNTLTTCKTLMRGYKG